MGRMSTRIQTVFVSTLVLLFSLVFDVGTAAADPTAVANLYSLQGTAEYRSGKAASWTACSQGQTFALGDEIRVGESSRAGIQFADGLFIRLSSRASLKFDHTNSQASLLLGDGKAHFFNRASGNLPQVQTTVVTAAIRGTEFVVDSQGDTTTISVIEGTVDARNSFGSAVVGSGERAVTRKGHAPQKSILLSPGDAVQWTAVIPVLWNWELYRGGFRGASAQHARENVQSAVEQGNLKQAFDVLYTTRQGNMSIWSLLELDLLLTSGRIEDAVKLLDKGDWSGLPKEAAAKIPAYRALLALARNDLKSAKTYSEEALKVDATSPTAALAASYVAQAEKDLKRARELLRGAAAVAPENPTVLSRLAELELGFGNEKDAQELIARALKADPHNGYAYTVQGFIRLFRNEVPLARENFASAIANEPELGLAHLGAGLTKIHEGNLDAGRVDLERAVSLEPTRAVFRSYLGKAFFELEDETRAVREYDEAIRLDPNDPTPFLYRGFAQISRNRAVNALQDIEHAFALNDNRAVYRSSLMLDEDLAVKSAGLSRVFTDLGFEQTGRLEAIRSLSKDYSNFSAHRLLADSDRDIFGADASFSERRIADLLAPLSFNLFSGLSGRASLNEYDALFDQSERRTGVTVGYDQTVDNIFAEAVHSGKTDTLGYAMAVSAGYGGGSKKNDWDRDYRLDGALRYQVAPDHRVLFDAHGIYRKIYEGDAESEEIEIDSGTAGLGYSFRMDANSTFIGDVTVGRQRLLTTSSGLVVPADSTQIFQGMTDTLPDLLLLDQETKEYVTLTRGGGQYMYKSELWSLIAGAELIHVDPDRNETSLVLDDELGELAGNDLMLYSNGSQNLTATDFYLYPTFHVLPWLDLTAGVTRTDVETELREVAPFAPEKQKQSHWNPKAGLTATPLKNLTLRAAYFENLHKASLEDQVSIEPTLIGGLTQRFNDLSGTRSRNMGVGADYKIAASTYFGGEYLRRHLTEPTTDAYTEIITDIDLQEQYGTNTLDGPYDTHIDQNFARAYLYQVFNESFVGSLDYRYGYEEITDPELYSDLKAHRIAAQIKYFDPSGVFLFTRATWRKQEGTESDMLESGNETFWIYDAGVGYRLPKRRGIITVDFLNIGNRQFNIDQTRGFDAIVNPDFGVRVAAAFNF